MTNVIITPNQTRGTCPEFGGTWAWCHQDSQCPRGKTNVEGHGVLTGKCDTLAGVCEVSAWCPVENDLPPLINNRAVLEQSQQFTVLIKNQIYLKSCTHSDEHPFCPVFSLGYIVESAGQNY